MEDATRVRRLEALHRTTRELMEAETYREVATVSVRAASTVLGLDANAIHLYEDGEGLVPVASTPHVEELVGDLPTFTEGNGIAWRVYASGEPTVVEDVRHDPDVYNPDTPIRSEMFLPLGEHGILVAGSATTSAFDDEDQSLAQVLATNVEAALRQVDRKRELIRKNERLERFASVVSPDLRSPLTTARGYLDLAREDGDAEHFDRVEGALDRIESIVFDLLDLARAGDAIEETEPVALAAVAEDAWRAVEGAGVGSLELDEDLGRVSADASRLQQLLENLFRNALEHGVPAAHSHSRGSPDGRGDGAVTVRVETTPEGFAVADDGVGIPEDDRELVFNSGYSTRDDGTGYGLAIVEEIADAHGWNVAVTDSESGGARFEFTGVETAA
ncbi:sensor histidine kinase [Halocalculus aciditolerans]|uniref:histidine kinase n=1 Tax=Halocalculus aciditolerans TaxID=1383812 RepID=A0A830F958_9EURY|nr:GAF domain-containing sensor histidine kinase [Halocalculus aciditolerans]GGL66822.1 hypothetical protein GCM10009039_26020 [Halocalculus aciditolerans]